MATLPRMHSSKHGIPVSSPFSTSPRKLQEMALPVDGHDVTSASGISMKQYEEQLNGLRKENFHLKLRIYFLEEKLGNGSPPAVQGLLEHNVRLQVEVEELRRQLSDKQELLAAAAEAIDVLGQQGSISTDSVENVSMNNSDVQKKVTNKDQTIERKEVTDDTCLESESAGDYLATTANNDDMDELMKLRKENRKALQMIKGCMKKIQQQDKEIKKIKLNKELTYAQVSDSQMEKYEEILKCKDEHIKDLETKVRDLQKCVENVQNSGASGNLQQLLARRLQGVAYFLDKLLSHKCVLGEDKKKLAESILEQSLALPVGLELDESMAPEDFTLDESAFDMSCMSQSLRLEDLTVMLGHHAGPAGASPRRAARRARPAPRAGSESECWSEPDRTVSQARVGLCDTGLARDSPPPEPAARARRPRLSLGSRSEDKTDAFFDEIAQLGDRCERLERERKDLCDKLEYTVKEIEQLSTENRNLRADLDSERSSASEANRSIETLRCEVARLERLAREAELAAAEAARAGEALRAERRELEATFAERERALRRAADEATVQASQAALERARAQHERLRAERELEDARDRLAAALDDNSRLEIEAARRIVKKEEPPSEEDRPTSPDLGIDSDRLSSLEQNDAVALSPRSLYEENVTLKQKLSRTKATLADTLAQLNAANMRKKSVQRAICREIHRTHGVLRKARDQFENPQ